MRGLSGCAKSRADAAAKGIVPGARVRWSALARASFALADPRATGTYLDPSTASGFGNVRWDGRRLIDVVDISFIERAR